MRPRSRRSVRARGHDYAGGLYAVTACTWGRTPLFGAVLEGEVHLSPSGRIARDEWARTGHVREAVVLDASVVMPDHVHLLFGIVADDSVLPVGARRWRAQSGLEAAGTDRAPDEGTPTVCPYPTSRRFANAVPGTVSTVMRQCKSVVTKRIRALDPTIRVWQWGFYDRVVRSDLEADGWRRYIAENPARWDPAAAHRDGHRV